MRRRGRAGSPAGVLVALAVTGVLLTACDGVAPALACKVEVDTPELVEDRIAAGVADCDPAALGPAGRSGGAAGAAAQLPDVELACLGGEQGAALADVRGPAMINFWASNCGPCREEMPALQEFHERHGEQVAVIGVNYLDTYPGAAIDLERITGVTYPSLADACGDLQETDAELGAGLPFFLFVSADGSVSRPHAGGVDSLAEVVELAEDKLDIELDDAPGARR